MDVGSTFHGLGVFDDGGGPALHAGGSFSAAGGVTANRLARWYGTSWSALGPGVTGSPTCLAVHDSGTGPRLFAGGVLGTAGGLILKSIASWDGKQWFPSDVGPIGGLVNDVAIFDNGGGPALYAAGSFAYTGGEPVSRIGKWDGTRWLPLGAALDSTWPAHSPCMTTAAVRLCTSAAPSSRRIRSR